MENSIEDTKKIKNARLVAKVNTWNAHVWRNSSKRSTSARHLVSLASRLAKHFCACW